VPNDAALIDYYARRAKEYERIYDKPERQDDLARLKVLFQNAFAGREVLEIACGTGFWTEPVSTTAKSITATDINDEVLEIARAKRYGCTVHFQKADAFNPSVIGKRFNGGMAAAWWSHLRRSDIGGFLRRFHRQFSAGARIAFMDNRFVAGSNTPINRTDEDGNTYQLRTLANGERYEVLKNFPDEHEVREAVGEVVEFSWTSLPYYWFATYTLP